MVIFARRGRLTSDLADVVVAVALALSTSCVGDLGIDDVPWACQRDAQCGWRARCVDRVCVLVGAADTGTGDATADTATSAPDTTDTSPIDAADALEGADLLDEPEVSGLHCETTLRSPSPDQQAELVVHARESDGRLMITVRLDGLEAEYPLPPGVEMLDATTGPLTTCCENPCCPPL